MSQAASRSGDKSARPNDLMGLTEAEYGAGRADHGPHAQPGRVGHFLGDVERALLLQIVQEMAAQLPTKAPWVIQGRGENAGVIDIGDGLACIFKMESHNHPSFIEPYQGAATGVGGILRDVFTMGARPIANLNALRFGDPATPRPAIWCRAWSRGSAATAIAWACRRSAARSISTPPTTAISWSIP